ESRPEGRPHGAVPVGDVLDGDAAGRGEVPAHRERVAEGPGATRSRWAGTSPRPRSEEHTSELQSLTNLVCRLLLEKKNRHTTAYHAKAAYAIHRTIAVTKATSSTGRTATCRPLHPPAGTDYVATSAQSAQRTVHVN